ncbi:MAG: replication-associated recombination protein A [Clostridia bacterium]
MDMLFDKQKMAPLAERMRASVLSEFIGQEHILKKGSLLYRAILTDGVGSCIFWGPPGVGKTTLANIMANNTQSYFESLNAVLSGVKEAKKVIDDAIIRYETTGKRTYLLLDECHRWSKAQSDCVLQAIEKGYIIFIGSTTENPYASLTPAIVSRCRVFEFYKLSTQNIIDGLNRAINSSKGVKDLNVKADPQALEYIALSSCGDLRTAYNALELACLTTVPSQDGEIIIDKATAMQSSHKKAVNIDKQQYYDLISAFIKSMRGSDGSAAVYYFMRLLNAGVDPLLLARRIVIHSAEDVGLADPNALVVATAALTAFTQLGLPEGKIPLIEAVLYVSCAPKSNSVVTAIANVEQDALDGSAIAPLHLADASYPRSDKVRAGEEYKYPHDYGGYVDQQYLPDKFKDKTYYFPTNHGEDTGRKK